MYASGCKIVQVRLIFSPVYPQYLTGDNYKPSIYFYSESFKFSALYREDVDSTNVFKPAPYINMFLLNRYIRSNGRCMRDIIKLMDIREIVELVPCFGAKMDDQLDSNNGLNMPDSFHLNNFADKDTFHTILTYQ